VVSSDGTGEYEVAFEAFAGLSPRTLQPGTVAYIGTGGPLPEGSDAGWLPAWLARVC
jgi:gephyrin